MRSYRSLGAVILFLLVGVSQLRAVEKRTVSRNDHIYEAFPDVALTPGGTLVVVYRECMGHGPFPFSRARGTPQSGRGHELVRPRDSP